MKLIRPAFLVDRPDGLLKAVEDLKLIELYGRISHRTEDKTTENSYQEFIKKWAIKSGHETLLEHAIVSVRISHSRPIIDELVRHRIASPIVESTRYVNYKGGVTFIIPAWVTLAQWEIDRINHKVPGSSWRDIVTAAELDKQTAVWLDAVECGEQDYGRLIELGIKPEDARDILPFGFSSLCGITANYREMRHILTLRCHKAAHHALRSVMLGLLDALHTKIPVVFDDLYEIFIQKEIDRAGNT